MKIYLVCSVLTFGLVAAAPDDKGKNKATNTRGGLHGGGGIHGGISVGGGFHQGGRPIGGIGGFPIGGGGSYPGVGGGFPGAGGGFPGAGGGFPGAGGGFPGAGGGFPGAGGGFPVGGGFPGAGGGFPVGGGGFPVGGGGGIGGSYPGVGGSQTCRYWCRTPQGQAYCCESNQEPGGPVGVKPGNCPRVRPSCPPVRFGFQPPQPCSNDYRCGGTDKCCYDICLTQHVCKPDSYFG